MTTPSIAAPPLLRHFVAGDFRPATTDDWLSNVNPSDREDVLARVPISTPADVLPAVAGASEALRGWRNLPGPVRAEHLYRWAAALEVRAEELAQLMAREVGKPIVEARGELARGGVILRYYAGEAVRTNGELVPPQAAGALQFTLREPLGVVALITPWNFPVAIPLWKAAPALAFGNTVVLKPSEHAPLTALMLAEIARGAGLPSGVFNVLLGTGAGVGEALISAPEVRAVSFTGSARVGARVAALAAARNIRYQTEMGGKNVAIVLPDADLSLAARLIVAGAMRYAGQKCTATSRVVVAREIEEAFLRNLRTEVEALTLGPVTDPAAVVGPLINADARTRILDALREARGERLCGGEIPAGPAFARGNWVA